MICSTSASCRRPSVPVDPREPAAQHHSVSSTHGRTTPERKRRMSPLRTAFAMPLFLTLAALAPAKVYALDAVLCVNVKGNGPPKFRAAKPPDPAACKPKTEIQIGHFDGTTLQFTGINVQIVSGSGATNAVNGTGNLIVG